MLFVSMGNLNVRGLLCFHENRSIAPNTGRETTCTHRQPGDTPFKEEKLARNINFY